VKRDGEGRGRSKNKRRMTRDVARRKKTKKRISNVPCKSEAMKNLWPIGYGSLPLGGGGVRNSISGKEYGQKAVFKG